MNLSEVFELSKQIIITNNNNVNSYLSTPDKLYFFLFRVLNYYTDDNYKAVTFIIKALVT